MNITEFLEARIAEDEYEANTCLAQYRRGEGGTTRRWTRQLAECAAKRAIVDLAKKASEFEKWYDDYEWQGTVESSEPLTGDAILYALAVIYKDHSDYRQEWAL